MVFFTCNACNESLKKNQVEKHYQQKCRRCEFLSCVDCGKDFWGDSYQSHTKCISEEEKYSGKNYVAKVNKGEVKQEQWIQKVQSAIRKAPADPHLKQILQRLEEYPNVPRKKAKFQNFLKSSMRVFNGGLQNQVWDLLMAEAQQQPNGNSTQGDSHSQEEPESKSSSKEEADPGTVTLAADQDEGEKKLSKKERKEERRKKAHKAEKKDKHKEDRSVPEEIVETSKAKGKRKKRDEEGEEVNGVEECSRPKKKRKKEENGFDENGCLTNDSGLETLDDSVTVEEKTGKFNWGLTITTILESKGEISVKKLRKKVLAEYASYGGSKGDEKVMAKFSKKLSKLPNVKVLKDRAKLIQS